VARQFSTGTKFGSEKGKVQKPALIPPQTPPAGGKKAEAGQFHSPRKIVCPADLSAVALAKAESKLVLRIFVKKSSNINQKTPQNKKLNKFFSFYFAETSNVSAHITWGIRKAQSCFFPRKNRRARPVKILV
jgi:hypothetical protein